MDGRTTDTKFLPRQTYDRVIDNVTLTEIFKDYLRHSMLDCFTITKTKLETLKIYDFITDRDKTLSLKYCTYDDYCEPAASRQSARICNPDEVKNDKYFNFNNFSIKKLHTISEYAIKQQARVVYLTRF